jgi:N6-L-threonylcarbamoyladenine synthase
MDLLAIETSCDETAAAVVRDGRLVLSSVVSSQIDLHRRYGGVVPELASRQHITAILPVIQEALTTAGRALDDIDAVGVTRGPGLAGALLVGLNAAKAIAFARGLPLIGVNHLEGHIYSNWLAPGTPDEPLPPEPTFPLVCLIVSGGHTDLLLMTAHGRYELLGRTLDDAAGEAFDKAARLLGLGYPGGPSIERAANSGDASELRLPRAWLGDSLDFSFSGLKTALLRLIEPYQKAQERHTPQPGSPFPLHTPARLHRGAPVADLAAAFQESVVDVLIEKTARAAEQSGATCVLLAGGVAANRLLRQRLAERIALSTYIPPLRYCTDNAAMIGAAAAYRLAAGQRDGLDLDAVPNLSLTSEELKVQS